MQSYCRLHPVGGVFSFEFVEGNTITRIQFRRTLRGSRDALERGDPLTDDLRDEARSPLNQLVLFLDVPLFTVIVYCGTVRSDSWLHVFIAVAIGLFGAILLMFFVPRLAQRRRFMSVGPNDPA